MPDEQLAAPLCLESFRRRKVAAPINSGHAQFTIADVAAACGLPQPVVAQLVPRTWTDAGWMYTADQLQFAVQIGPDVANVSLSSQTGYNSHASVAFTFTSAGRMCGTGGYPGGSPRILVAKGP